MKKELAFQVNTFQKPVNYIITELILVKGKGNWKQNWLKTDNVKAIKNNCKVAASSIT